MDASIFPSSTVSAGAGVTSHMAAGARLSVKTIRVAFQPVLKLSKNFFKVHDKFPKEKWVFPPILFEEA